MVTGKCACVGNFASLDFGISLRSLCTGPSSPQISAIRFMYNIYIYIYIYFFDLLMYVLIIIIIIIMVIMIIITTYIYIYMPFYRWGIDSLRNSPQKFRKIAQKEYQNPGSRNSLYVCIFLRARLSVSVRLCG